MLEIVGEREVIFEKEGKVFLRGINYIDSKGAPRAMGFRGDIMDWINSANEETGHFVLRNAEGIVEEEGDIKEVFYSASANPRIATCVPIQWSKYVVERKPNELETITLGYVPVPASV